MANVYRRGKLLVWTHPASRERTPLAGWRSLCVVASRFGDLQEAPTNRERAEGRCAADERRWICSTMV